jgi:hypothetical protein
MKAQAKPNWMTGQSAAFNTMGSWMGTNLPSFPGDRLARPQRRAGEYGEEVNQRHGIQQRREPAERANLPVERAYLRGAKQVSQASHST